MRVCTPKRKAVDLHFAYNAAEQCYACKLCDGLPLFKGIKKNNFLSNSMDHLQNSCTDEYERVQNLEKRQAQINACFETVPRAESLRLD